MIIVMVALRSLPVIPTLTALRWNKIPAPIPIQMPFAYEGRRVASRFQYLRETQFLFRQVSVIEEHSGRGWVAAGHQGCAIWRANRTDRHRITEIYGVVGKGEYDIWFTCPQSRRPSA